MKFLAYTTLSPILHGSGGERYIQNFLEKLSEKGDECVCYSTNKNDVLLKKRVLNKITYLKANKDFASIIKDENPDYVITQLGAFVNDEIEIAHKMHIKIIYIAHNDLEYTTCKEISKLSHNDICIFNTNWIYRKLERRTKAKCCVMHPILSVKDIETTREYITFINLIKEKGSGIAYRVALILRNEKFLFVKGGYKNQEIIRLPNITFVENSDDIFNDVYSKTKILLEPSLYESYGMVAAEAAYCGIPCVLSKTAGFKECLGNTSIMLNSTNPIDYANAIMSLRDKQKYDLYSRKTKEFIEKDMRKPYFEECYNIIKRRNF